MKQNPLISVIMPVYNTEKYLNESIQSIFNQTYKNIELICINDCSTDKTLNILEQYDKINIINNKINLGAPSSRNIGLEHAKGDFIAFMDADDIWINNKLELQLSEFNNDENLDICFSYMKCFFSPELDEEFKRKIYCPEQPIMGYISITSLIKKEVFEKIGLFNNDLRVGDFIDWFDRAKEAKINFNMLENIFLMRRIHQTNTGIINKNLRTDYLKVVRASLERKRMANK